MIVSVEPCKDFTGLIVSVRVHYNDGTIKAVPFDSNNIDYKSYLAWIGNEKA